MIRTRIFKTLTASVFAATLVAAGGSPALADPAPGTSLAPMASVSEPIVPDRYLVMVKPEAIADHAAQARLERAVDRAGGTILYRYARVLDGFAAKLPDVALAAVRADPSVSHVEPVSIVTGGPGGPDAGTRARRLDSPDVSTSSDLTVRTTQPNPPGWGIDRIDQRNLPLDKSYKYDTTGAGVTAYVVDSGIRATHVEFGGRASGVANFVDDGNGTNDCHGHGTHVAGILGGGQHGVAKQVTIKAVRVLRCDNSGTTDDLIAGLEWIAVHHDPVSVANLSLQGYPEAVNAAVERVIDAGVHMVMIANNFNTDACTNSPRSPRGVVVAATDSTDTRYVNSSYGECVDVFAPGVSIESSVIASDTAVASWTGTSMAAPHVAGWVARYLEKHPTATQAEVLAAVVAGSTKNVVADPGPGSPNRLLYAAPPGVAEGTCRVDYQATGQDASEFTANVTITNTGAAALDGWQLVWDFTAGQRVINGWNATWSQNGARVTAANVSWNRTLAAGGSVWIGFQGSWSGSNPVPSKFTLNGVACTTA